jgi:hypothetical protein
MTGEAGARYYLVLTFGCISTAIGWPIVRVPSKPRGPIQHGMFVLFVVSHRVTSEGFGERSKRGRDLPTGEVSQTAWCLNSRPHFISLPAIVRRRHAKSADSLCTTPSSVLRVLIAAGCPRSCPSVYANKPTQMNDIVGRETRRHPYGCN